MEKWCISVSRGSSVKRSRKHKEIWDLPNRNNFSKKGVSKEGKYWKLIPFIVDILTRDTSTISIQLGGSSPHNLEEDVYILREITKRNLHIDYKKLLKVLILMFWTLDTLPVYKV